MKGRRLVAGDGLGAAAGLAGVVGTSLLYQGLAIGRMSVVAEPEGGLEGRVKKVVTSASRSGA